MKTLFNFILSFFIAHPEKIDFKARYKAWAEKPIKPAYARIFWVCSISTVVIALLFEASK